MKKLEEIIARILEVDVSQIRPNLTPDDIETWDSLGQLLLINNIEEEFDIIFEIKEIFQIMKIGDIYDLLRKKGVL